jgi:DNA/RNA-binding domain of Phe-tRNA-synthetase-like protein
MKYSIEGVIEKYPEINIGVLVGTGLNINKLHPDLEKYKSDALLVAEDLIGCNSVTRHPYIASWRNMYRSFGAKPADYHPSAEALARRALKTQQLPLINTSVDTYNAVSIKYLIPIGGFDINLVEGDIVLRFSMGKEAFLPLGGIEYEYTYDGEVVYADNKRVLTRRWNYRDCDETKITEKTVNVVMFVDGTPEIPRVEIGKALEELAFKLKVYCDGSYSTNIADSGTPIIKIN